MSAKLKAAPAAAQRTGYAEPSNPLACQSRIDAMRNVHAVLGFVTSAIVAMQEDEAPEYEMGDGTGEGLYLILSCCQTALGAHLIEEARRAES